MHRRQRVEIARAGALSPKHVQRALREVIVVEVVVGLWVVADAAAARQVREDGIGECVGTNLDGDECALG